MLQSDLTIGCGMNRLIVSLLSLSLVCGPCALAQDVASATKSDYPPNFLPNGYRPLPPHFQPRRVIAADLEKVEVAPPPLPIYQQPAIPTEGYLWVPGYWAWRKSVPDYFWVPGTWVRPPQSGLLWTPPYWSRVDGGYAFHAGYWAIEVGFYGGIDYGFGYTGRGYQGGRWEHGTFTYNRATNNLGSIKISGVYDQAVDADSAASRLSFNGSRLGTTTQPSRHHETLAGERHVEATSEQQKHLELAGMDRSLYSKLNNDKPGVAATPHAGIFTGPGITSSRPSSQTAQSSDDGLLTHKGVEPPHTPDIPDRTEKPVSK
jgi:WXXGXW repeat (2 copies)